jgi:glycosyltransferase involved in cell wall biosynthesis
MVSVCMSIKNGGKYLESQVESILPQLGTSDELVVCDDHSTDNSVSIIESFNDDRIRILTSPNRGMVASFGHALEQSRGDFIFLADQDDIWVPNKVERMCSMLKSWDLVVCDCALIDEHEQVRMESFFQWNRSGKGLVRNLFRNSYMGCCMAFTQKVKEHALPFPDGIVMHDYWIGLVSELYFRPMFIHESLVLHRRHGGNLSTTGRGSAQAYAKRISQRLTLIKNLVNRTHG